MSPPLSTDTAAPRLATPISETAAPNRAKLRKDREEPMAEKAITANEQPRRTLLITERVELKRAAERKDKEDPSLA